MPAIWPKTRRKGMSRDIQEVESISNGFIVFSPSLTRITFALLTYILLTLQSMDEWLTGWRPVSGGSTERPTFLANDRIYGMLAVETQEQRSRRVSPDLLFTLLSSRVMRGWYWWTRTRGFRKLDQSRINHLNTVGLLQLIAVPWTHSSSNPQTLHVDGSCKTQTETRARR